MLKRLCLNKRRENNIKPKERILEHYHRSIQFVSKLEGWSDEQWLMPLAIGKWSTCEIIGHLIFWDQFLIEKRLPALLLETEKVVTPKVHEANAIAASMSKEKLKGEVIQEFIEERQRLLTFIDELSHEIFDRNFSIGKSHLTLNGYFEGLMEHDLHHFQQIKDFMIEFDKKG